MAWQTYYDRHQNSPPRQETARALSYLNMTVTVAVDLGFGNGHDTAYLAEHGCQVIAVDPTEEAQVIGQQRVLRSPNVRLVKQGAEAFEFPKADLILAHFSLFFMPKERFSMLWRSMLESLTLGGILSCHLMGLRDDWVKSGHCWGVGGSELAELLQPWHLIEKNETDELGGTAAGPKKHWHVYQLMLQKK